MITRKQLSLADIFTLAAISDNAVFRAIYISIYHVTDGDFMQFNLHCLPCFLRIVILA